MTESLLFPATRREALARAQSIDPALYARTRNALDGRVTRLSPYLTHGLISVGDVLGMLCANYRLGWQDKIVFELGWREYFHHVWDRLDEGIWQEPHAPPASAAAYQDAVADDVRTAQTGVAIIDQQITRLYQTGYLHNHARMWIASYLVHIRKINWRAGARWMYSHLLDGDMASNTLSWQWVAGTWTGKPYLFNAENVARYAPGVDCSGTVIDTTYEALDAIARSDKPVKFSARGATSLVVEPSLFSKSPEVAVNAQNEPLPDEKNLRVMHPWSLHSPNDNTTVGVINTDFHHAYPWSSARWRFVETAMREQCAHIVYGTTNELAQLFKDRNVTAVHTLNPHYRELIERIAPNAAPAPRAFANPKLLKRSFTSFWNHISKEAFPL
jgi:deoxyribodipyrimidine photo-lyase